MVKDERRVLIVSDEPPLRKLLRSSLQNDGFRAVEECSIEQSFELISGRLFDLVLIDINLQWANGLELCREMRALGKDTGVVMITLRDSETHTVEALEAGADDCITKPFRLRELVARCRAVVRRVRADKDPEEGIIEAGELVVDLGRRVVRKAGNIIRLTPTEFNLLVFLMKHSDVLVRHAKLLSAIWGPACREQVEYLRCYVRQLRKKIEDDPANPKYLRTEPWLGYRFCTSVEAYSISPALSSQL